METKIKQFWEYFEKESFFILEGFKYGIVPKEKFELLDYLLTNIHPKLQLLINRPPNGEIQLVFLTKGRLSLKVIITEILKRAPENEYWVFKMGLPPWNGTLEEFCSHYQFLGPDIYIYDIYFDIYKIHSNGKVNLHIHVEKNKPLPKYFINDSMRIFLLYYLGDRLFFKKIVYLKIVQKKYRHINFIPIYELKTLLEFSRVT
ncbi:hypothetical protein A7A78_14175 [Aequorivita soesokkakensis]|uniref:Uncharacterized protein n=1 Tax=Aequorivita soesokkakensis TaxID=1385699 RepID=A0A1A9LCF6_9FLAO|nr:hypothetical protein [Aequorivita soesokkakensis]OAD90757.1 hypothetical protein A7A78_14175 [Aequorivita soesokkakensis]